ncbi:MAG: hypothetical protein KDA44_02735 [Planctomycetales bacterium]|nr:hypothetical protein [Planctomycetales bacterium]
MTPDPQFYYVAAAGLLGVRTNIKDFKWSYGTAMPEATADEFQNCRLRLTVELDRNLELPPCSERLGKYHYWSGSEGSDAIYYDRTFMFGRQLRLAAQGLCGVEPTIRVNGAYLRYVTHRFMNLHSLGYILTDLASLMLLHQGFAPIHCSAFQAGNATVVVAAPPNTGKTLTSVSACMNRGAKFIAEDLAITDGTNVYSIPWTSTFRYYSDIDKSWGARFGNAAKSIFPPLELIRGSHPRPITEYLPPEQFADNQRVTHVVVLERGESGVRTIGDDEAFQKLRNLNRYEFNYCRAPMLVAHEFFNPKLDIEGAHRAEAEILQTLASNADETLAVTTLDPPRYADLILEALGERAADNSIAVAA